MMEGLLLERSECSDGKYHKENLANHKENHTEYNLKFNTED